MRHPAENEQGDLPDRDLVTQRHIGMSQFMQQDREKQQERGNTTHPPIAWSRQAWQHLRQIARRQGPGDKEKHRKPGRMYVDRDTERTTDFPIG